MNGYVGAERARIGEENIRCVMGLLGRVPLRMRHVEIDITRRLAKRTLWNNLTLDEKTVCLRVHDLSSPLRYFFFFRFGRIFAISQIYDIGFGNVWSNDFLFTK